MKNDWEDVYNYAARVLKYEPKKVDGISYIHIAPPQMDLEKLKCTFNTGAIIQPIRDKAKQVQDKTVINAIIDYAQKQGITDLFVIDEAFVKNAIKHEWAREHKPQTNFDKITQNEEALAEFIDKVSECCTNEACQDCPMKIIDCKHKTIKEWLQKECE
jgi:hypothetical protein